MSIKDSLLLLDSQNAREQWCDMYSYDEETLDHHMLFNGHEFSIIIEIDPYDIGGFKKDPYIKLCSSDNIKAAAWDKSIGVSKITLINPMILYNDNRYTPIAFNKKVLKDLNEAFMNYKTVYRSSQHTVFDAVKYFLRYECYCSEFDHKDSIDFTVIDNYKEYYKNVVKIYNEPWEDFNK